MRKEHQFRKLRIWQRSMELVTRIYKLTSTFPKHEKYGLIDQIRRAALSIPLNIAEGSGCVSNIDFVRFLSIAKRSGYEVISGLEVSKNLTYADGVKANDLIREIEEICSMIVGLSKQLKS